MITNAVRNLLNFTRTSQKEIVASIKGPLQAAWKVLKDTEMSHRNAQQKIGDLLNELDKPWIIKTQQTKVETATPIKREEYHFDYSRVNDDLTDSELETIKMMNKHQKEGMLAMNPKVHFDESQFSAFSCKFSIKLRIRPKLGTNLGSSLFCCMAGLC